MGKIDNRYIVILAGGGGSRLWPKSRVNSPKQFLKLVSDRTMLQETADRVVGSFIPWERLYVVVARDYTRQVKEQLPDLPEENILTEPMPKGNAAAVGLAAIHILKKNPEAVISTLAADHLIEKPAEFRRILTISADAAEKGDYLVTIGIVPAYAHTGFGYLHTADEKFVVGKQSVFELESFTEKPNLPTAQAFLATGEYFWNANINSFKISAIMSAFQEFMPDLYLSLQKISNEVGTDHEKEILVTEWEKLENVAIDYGVLEKADNVLMVPGDFGWSDIGDWNVLYEVSAKIPDVNVLTGDEAAQHLGIETSGCLIHSSDRLIATIGLTNLVIVDTPDALLICPRERAQEVKKLVEKLRLDKKNEYL